ncbi:uncharacterized protein LOC111643688 [Copidosoma floridanum]|uniref:uncharacterized protein LOC111643688 n=1 Tax=Copidosoma floridanum TaxID=29053 RepID=UPI000C6F5EF6|nr:uncharacterized protein LOC111643688 [Copidosoma floridanum]
MSERLEEQLMAMEVKIREETRKSVIFFRGRETHLSTCFNKATEETRQLNLKPSKDYHLLPDSKRVHQTELDCAEFDKDTIKVIVRGELILVQGTKKNQRDETTLTYDIPDQCDLARIEAGFYSDDVLYIRFPLKNEPDVKV